MRKALQSGGSVLRSVRTPIRVAIFCFLVAWMQPTVAGAEGLHGDKAALARVDAMLETLGGKAVWAHARSLYTMERARDPAHGDGIVATFWRDLEKPAERAELRNDKVDMQYAWDASGGWILRDGKIEDLDDAEVEARASNWHREIYTLYHQLALGERDLMVKDLAPNGFRVYDEKANKVADFQLTPDGELYLWQQHGEDPVAYIYGPHKDFGTVRFPDWGTSTDGSWGFYYVQVYPSARPFEKNATLRKPRLEWMGGALHSENCEP